MKKNPLYINYFFYIWALLMIVAYMFTISSATIGKCRYYDEKIAATTLAKEAMNQIKDYKNELGIAVSAEDVYDSGILGDRYTVITTTLGNLQSKKTSLNPNFAAVIIDMFKEAEIVPGDEVAVIFSSSFPALNICVMSAIEIFRLKPCVMVSIGASSYGANNPNLTYFDMAKYLYDKGTFSNDIDYVSLGGESDLGSEYPEDVRESILSRIDNSSSTLIYEEDYLKNLQYRIDAFYEDVPDLKMLINVGGNLVSMGKDEESFSSENGLILPTYIRSNLNRDVEKIGLIDKFLDLRIPVIHMLNIKGLALEYGLPYNPTILPNIGEGDVYYEKQYNIVVPGIALGVSMVLLGIYYIYRKKYL